MKIYGNKQSSAAMKVVYLAELLGIEYDYQHMDFQKDLKKPEYLAIHPLGKIPAIVDGFPLWESNAIMRYLAAKNSKHYPADLHARAIVDQWLDFSSIHVGAAISKVAFNRAFAPQMGLPVDEQSIKDGLGFLDKQLPVINTRLGESALIAGDELSIADISLFSVFEYLALGKIDVSAYPHIVSYIAKIEALPWCASARKAVEQ